MPRTGTLIWQPSGVEKENCSFPAAHGRPDSSQLSNSYHITVQYMAERYSFQQGQTSAPTEKRTVLHCAEDLMVLLLLLPVHLCTAESLICMHRRFIKSVFLFCLFFTKKILLRLKIFWKYRLLKNKEWIKFQWWHNALCSNSKDVLPTMCR